MELGTFSISLTVRDLDVSRQFYEKLGFVTVGGDAAHGFLIIRSGDSTIGLFQGMFDRNVLTFNPGWDKDATTLDDYTDVREIQRELVRRGLTLIETVDEEGKGPGHITLEDPDGNPILIDQHI